MSQIEKCPKCGRTFSRMYSRTFACGGCPSSSLGNCGMVKCPFCGHEWPGSSSRIPNLV